MAFFRNAFKSFFSVKSEELRPLSLLFALSFCRGLAAVFFDAPANTLFISRFGSDLLPYVYLCAAGSSLLLGFGYSKLGSQWSPTTVLQITLSGLILSVLLFYGGLLLTEKKSIIMGLMIWKEALFMLSNIVMWASAGYLFDVRQGKRLFGFVASGGILAMIIGGTLIPLIIRFSGIHLLFLLSAFALIAMLLVFRRLSSTYQDCFSMPLATNPLVSEQKKITDLFRNRYLLLFFGLSVLSNFGFFFVDYVYFNRIEIAFPNEEKLAGFFGLFSAIVGAVQLITSTFLSGPLMTRFGLGFGLMALPALNALGMGIAALISMTVGTGSSFLGLILLTKLCDEALRSSLLAPSFRILYQPLPKNERLRFQAVTESIIEPLGVGLAGAFLLLFTHVYPLPLHFLCLLLMAILIGWLAVGERLRREYTRLLTQALSKRRLTEVSLSLEDGSTVQIFEAGLKSPNPAEVIYCLQMLEEVQHPEFQKFLHTLIDHPEPSVRENVIKRIIHFPSARLVSDLKKRLEMESIPALRGEILKALCAHIEEEEIDWVLPFLEERSPEVRSGAISGLMEHGGIEGILVAGSMLQKMVASPDCEERLLAAKTLSKMGSHRFYRPLLQLLHDPDSTIVNAALKACEKLPHIKPLPRIFECLNCFSHRSVAFNTLLKIGDQAIPSIEALLNQNSIAPSLRQRLFKLLGRIGGPPSIAILKRFWNSPDLLIRLHALQSLVVCGYRARDTEIEFLKKQIHHEVIQSIQLHSMIVNLGIDDHLITLRKALESEIKSHQEQLFILLSFLYHSPGLLAVQKELDNPSSVQRAHALEVLDNHLSSELKEMIFPLLDDLSTQERLSKLQRYEASESLSAEQQLHALLLQENSSISSWTRACALFVAGKIRFPGYQALATPFLQDQDLLIRETAQSLLNNNV